MIDTDGNEWACSTCGAQEEFTVRGYRHCRTTEWGTWGLEEIDEDGDIYSTDDCFECDDQEYDSMTSDDYYEEIICNGCGEPGTLERSDEMDWDAVEDYQSSRPSDNVKRAIRNAHNTSILHKDTDLELAAYAAVAKKLVSAADMDAALKINEKMGLVAYKHGPEFSPDHPWTPEKIRLYEMARELVAQGFESVDHYIPTVKVVDGDLNIRRYDIYHSPTDNLMELDMGETPEAGSHHILFMSVLQDIPMIGIKPVKHFMLTVPKLAIEKDADEEWDDRVFIAEVTNPEDNLQTIFESDDHWTPDEFDQLTWYACSRDKLRQTLEVVFDITPGGYIPLKAEAREHVVTTITGV